MEELSGETVSVWKEILNKQEPFNKKSDGLSYTDIADTQFSL